MTTPFDDAEAERQAFYCIGCHAWLRERDELSDGMHAEALDLNRARPRASSYWMLASRVGNRALVVGTVTISVSERGKEIAGGEGASSLDAVEIRRYCAKCGAVVKDALMELGFDLTPARSPERASAEASDDYEFDR